MNPDIPLPGVTHPLIDGRPPQGPPESLRACVWRSVHPMMPAGEVTQRALQRLHAVFVRLARCVSALSDIGPSDTCCFYQR